MTTIMLLIEPAVGVGLGLGLGLGFGTGVGVGLGALPTPPHPIAASMRMPERKPMARLNVSYLRYL